MLKCLHINSSLPSLAFSDRFRQVITQVDMIPYKLLIIFNFIIFYVSGYPVSETNKKCEGFLWNVLGNHYGGENCALQKNYVEIHKPRLTKREDASGLTSNAALNTIGSFMNLVNSNLNLNVKTEPEVVCKACKTGMQMIKIFILLSKSNEELMKLATGLCVQLKIMTEEVCEGLININGPSIIHILKTTNMTPRDICSFLVKTDCEDVKNPDHIWSVNVPEKKLKQGKKLAVEDDLIIQENASKLKVLHISDTHFDPRYREGTLAECSLPLCCRQSSGEPTENATLAGPWGGWKCDIPEKTLDNLLEHINKEHPDIDYVVWTGDIPPHDSWSLYKNESLDIMNKTIAKMLKHFPNIPVYPALGNHETVPPNLFPPQNFSGSEWSVDWLYEEIEKSWSHWLGNDSSSTLRRGGFYTVNIRPGFRLISLNMNYCYYNNWWLILNSTDPMEELKWLVEVLQEAEKNDEKVHIIGHIPAGYIDCLKVWQENYYNIIKRFNQTVRAQFFGHTHMDEFELFYNKEDLNNSIGVAYVGPSVTTYTYLNPGYRIYYIDGDHNKTTRFVMDYETWIMDLENANDNDSPVWSKLYSAREAYNLTSLTPQSWHEFYQKLNYDEDLFDLYYKHYWKDSPKRPVCDENCKRKLLCDIRSCNQFVEPNEGL